MSGTAPRGDQGGCDTKACVRPFDHRGKCMQRKCQQHGCNNLARNGEEWFCVVHESRETYERYEKYLTTPDNTDSSVSQ